MTDAPTREQVAQALRNGGIGDGGEVCSWRCADKERCPGPCSCPEDIADALMPLIRAAQAEAWRRGRVQTLDQVGWATTFAAIPSPYETPEEDK